uniref:Uncharacterized protein n=1 Tax=Ditylenchus dipsaci TaxID=166011 RepID=A0A915DRK9_9BILA
MRKSSALHQCNAHRNTLGQAHPAEPGLTLGSSWAPLLRSRSSIAGGKALHMAAQAGVVAPSRGYPRHRRGGCRQAWFLRSNRRRVTVHRAAYHRAVEVELGGIDCHCASLTPSGRGHAGLLPQLLGRHRLPSLRCAVLSREAWARVPALAEGGLGLAQGQGEAVLVDVNRRRRA